MNNSRETSRFYRQPSNNEKGSKSILFFILFILASMIVAFLLLFMPKTLGDESMTGKIVKISGKSSIVGVVEEYEQGKYIVIRPIYDEKEQSLFFKLDEYSVAVIAKNIDEFNKLFPNPPDTKGSDSFSSAEGSRAEPEAVEQENSVESPLPEKQPESSFDSPKPYFREEPKEVNQIPSAPAKRNSAVFFAEKRKNALDEYEDEVRTASHWADSLDSNWDRFMNDCPGISASTTYNGRNWFILYSDSDQFNMLNSRCWKHFRSCRSQALDIRRKMKTAADNARRAGLFPGDLRDIQRKYKLVWDGWER